MELFKDIVAIVGGLVLISGFLWGIVKGVNKLVSAINKQCPCDIVKDLQATIERHEGYFQNDGRAIKELQTEWKVLNNKVEAIKSDVSEIKSDVKDILKGGVYK